jgi:hypothetical protein
LSIFRFACRLASGGAESAFGGAAPFAPGVDWRKEKNVQKFALSLSLTISSIVSEQSQ